MLQDFNEAVATNELRGYCDTRALRQWYAILTANQESREIYTFPFVDLLYDITVPMSIQAALDTEELRYLRRTVLVACQLDLIKLFQTNPLDRLLRQRLIEYYHAIQMLGPPVEDGTYLDLLVYTLLCVALDRHREARDLAKKLLTLKPQNDTAQSILEYAEDHMSLPRFYSVFITRSRNAWAAASQYILDYRRGKILQEQLTEQVRKVFDIWLGISADADVTSRREGIVSFTSNNWPLDLYSVQASVYAGLPEQPDSLRENWLASVSAGARYETVLLENGAALDLSTVQTAVEDNVAHTGVRVKVYHDAISPVAACPEVQEQFTHVVEHILGAPDFCINVRAVETMRAMPRHVTGTLATLVQQIEALGYTSGHEIDDVAPIRLRRTYTQRPQAGPGPRLRDDIRKGDTICWALQDDYTHQRTDTADHYMNRGIAPVFLAWPRSIMDCDEETYTQRLINVLREGDLPYNVQVLGKASGTQYCYLDLLAWSSLQLVEALEKHLSEIPNGDTFRLQSFYYDAYPCPISMARTQEHSTLRSLNTAFLSDEPAASKPGVKPSAVRPKEKKENAAKARRKHNKRHH